MTIEFTATCPTCGRPATWTATQVQHPAEANRYVPPTSHIVDIQHQESA